MPSIAPRAALTGAFLLTAMLVTAFAGEIHNAARRGDSQAVADIIEKKGRIELASTTAGGVTPLHIASALGHAAVAELLLANGADANARTSSGFTPLHWAASRDASQTAGLLIRNGANLNVATPTGITPLHWAASKNATNVVRLLLVNSADCAPLTRSGMTPLHWAIMKNAEESAMLLAFTSVSGAPDEQATHTLDVAELDSAALAEESAAISAADPTNGLHAQVVDTAPADIAISIGGGDKLAMKWLPELNIWMSIHEITNRQYRRYAPSHNSMFWETFSLDGRNHPVVHVSWHEARDFCAWVSSNGASVPADTICRLPTDAEWEAAARCSTVRTYPWGDGMPPAHGNFLDASVAEEFPQMSCMTNFNDGHVVTCDVELSGANEWGLLGMAGNAWEWCEGAGDETQPTRTFKGGSWDCAYASMLEIAYSGNARPETRDAATGFRIVLAPR